MLRTYKYRLYPNPAQAEQLDFLLWQGRKVYNAALEQRITAYQEDGTTLTSYDQYPYFRDMRRNDPDVLGQLNAAAIQRLLRRLDKAYAAFFRRLKAGETPGFPRFKGRAFFNSLEFIYGNGCKLRIEERVMFYVQNAGAIKVRYHRPLPEEAVIKQAVIKRQAQKWYVCLSLELPDPCPPAHPGPAVGIDMGLHHLLALSDGTIIENPRWLRADLKKLRIAQRRLARRKKGSNRRRKAAAQVARLHAQIANRRRDFWHKVANDLVQRYSQIVLEDLTLKFMTANHYLALSAHDAGLGEFQELLAYKAEEAGVELVFVNPAYTSQRCSGCGAMVEKPLSVRIHQCPDCGLTIDRDVNAARNILFLTVESARTGPSGANVTR